MATSDDLWNALQTAREAYFDAVAATSALLQDLPSGLPDPDGRFRIAQASRFQKIAHDRYVGALEDYNEALENTRLPKS